MFNSRGFWRFGFDPRVCKSALPRKSGIAGCESPAHWRLKRRLAQAALKLGWRVAFEVPTPVRVADVVCINENRAVALEAVCNGALADVKAYVQRAGKIGFPLFCFSAAPKIIRWGNPPIIDARGDLSAILAPLLAEAAPYEASLPTDYCNYTFANQVDVIRNMPNRVPKEALARMSNIYQNGLRDACWGERVAFFLSYIPPAKLKRLGITMAEIEAVLQPNHEIRVALEAIAQAARSYNLKPKESLRKAARLCREATAKFLPCDEE